MLDQAAQVLPADARVVVVANRAFGGPVLTDQAPAHGWDGLAPVHGQTRWRDRQGRIPPMVQQVTQRGDRWNGQGEVFIAVLIEVEPPWTSTVTLALPTRRPK